MLYYWATVFNPILCEMTVNLVLDNEYFFNLNVY